MIRYKDIHIAQPCTKIDFDSLPFDSIKRTCNLCSKSVYDFRDKDEKFLNKIWKEQNGDFCGIFLHKQFSKASTLKKGKFSLHNFKNTAASLLLGLWTFISNAQSYTPNNKLTSEYRATDSIDTKKSFQVLTKECRKCVDEFRVTILINDIYYKTRYINDSTVITLPDTIKSTDIITIKQATIVSNRRKIKTITNVSEKQFAFNNKDIVEVKITRKKRITLIRKRRSYIMGMPSDYW